MEALTVSVCACAHARACVLGVFFLEKQKEFFFPICLTFVA